MSLLSYSGYYVELPDDKDDEDEVVEVDDEVLKGNYTILNIKKALLWGPFLKNSNCNKESN